VVAGAEAVVHAVEEVEVDSDALAVAVILLALACQPLDAIT
jgi:hypothetical protein